MAFDGLTSRLQSITRKLGGKARITESDLKEILREVKLALLEADVNYKIVKEFISDIETKALGQNVLTSLTPGQQVVKIVKDELVELLRRSRKQYNLYTKSTYNNNAYPDFKALVKQRQQENLQIYSEKKGESHYSLHVMYIDQLL